MAVDEPARRFLYDTADAVRLTALTGSSFTPLAGLVAKMRREETYHLAHMHTWLHRLAVNARKLERLLSDLLDLDRLARGVLEPRRRLTDMPQLTNRVMEETDLGGHPIIIEVEPLMVHVDAPKVERVVENLLVNAAKHTGVDDRVWLRIARR